MKRMHAADAPTSNLLTVTTRLIDQLLENLPEGLKKRNYCGETSSTITGYEGIQVFLFSDSHAKLQVNGPDALLRALIAHYRGRLTLHDRGNQRAVFLVSMSRL